MTVRLKKKKMFIVVWLLKEIDNLVIVSALLEAGQKISQVANFIGMSSTTAYAIK